MLLPRERYRNWPVDSPTQLLLSQAPKKAKRRAGAEGSSNVFSMFDQTQIQEFKEVREGD